MANAGVPASAAPATSHRGVRTCARCHGGGHVGARCGSLASSGLPDAVREPATAQLFDPPPGGRKACIALRSAASLSSKNSSPTPPLRREGLRSADKSGSPSLLRGGGWGERFRTGSSAVSAEVPSASRMRSRASSASQLEGSRKDCSLSSASTSAASHRDGVPPTMANSCGFFGRPAVVPAFMPAAKASNSTRASALVASSCATAARRKPMCRLMRSAGSATAPTHAASVPRASRHITSSCPARS